MYEKAEVVDLLLYEGRDDDLITFYRSLRPAVSRMLLCAMLEDSRRQGELPIETLSRQEGSGGKIDKSKRVPLRLRISRQQYPDLVELWRSYPHGVKTTFFIAHLRNTLTKINAGAKISEKALLGIGASGEVSNLFLEEESTAASQEAPSNPVPAEIVEEIVIGAPKHYDDDLMGDATGDDHTLGSGSLVDDLLGSLDDELLAT